MGAVQIQSPLTEETISLLRVGDRVLLTGTIYTARDAAHMRLVAALKDGHDLPIPLQGQIIYYVGPAPAPPRRVIGPAGPTTSARMDAYTPPLLAAGLKGMIGKGNRSHTVRNAMRVRRAVYLVAVGGAAALLSDRIVGAEVVAYGDLGTEAIRKLEVEQFPLLVANDIYGGDLFETGKVTYQQMTESK